MKQTVLRAIIPASTLLILLAVASHAQETQTPYPAMTPLDQYLMPDRNAEIALARSAAPDSVSADAAIMVLTSHGYETAIQGRNGFVCIVERGWTAPFDDPNFWNPKLRGPLCLNAAAVRTYLPLTLKKTEWVLAGRSKAQIIDSLKAAFDKKELPTQEVGAMCYMLSRQQYLGDSDKHWHPHLMFFLPLADAKTWGANLPGSPIFAGNVPTDHLTIFMVPVAKWSDGTPDMPH